MTSLLDVFAFSSVVLRGLALSFQSLLIGGISFRFLMWRFLRTAPRPEQLLLPMLLLMRIAALGLAIVQITFVSFSSALLMSTAGFRLLDMVGADFFIA